MHKEFYAEYYQIEDRHWWFIGRRQIFLQILDKYLVRRLGPPPRRILDVGCGTGTMIGYLARYGQAEGIDMDADAVEFCHQRGVRQVQQVTSLPLPFPDASFDLVTALDVLEHIDDDRAMLRELYRILRPGGLFLLSVPAYRFLWGAQDEVSHHKRRYVAPEMRERLITTGFRVRRLSYFNTLLFPAIAAVRVLRPYRPGAATLKSDFTLTRPGPANTLLGRLFALEAPVITRWSLPFGVSILGLAAKPKGPPGPAPASLRRRADAGTIIPSL
ncbi:MAG TPA: methyltransferase domain-containing protein [Chloroflexia bacterium]|nr:methyltransferase domain-containing protein [Chloroflexia bacterium]